MLNDIKSDAEKRMQKSVESLNSGLTKLRTGRAHPGLLEHIMVDYYGTDTPINQVASVTVSDPRTLTISPWEKNLIPVIEKAIMKSDLGLNPVTSSEVIRVPLPSLTEERRKDMIKLVKAEAENARVAIRNIRRDGNNTFKDLLKDKEITEDEERRGVDEMQKLTDKFIAEVEKAMGAKESELLEI